MTKSEDVEVWKKNRENSVNKTMVDRLGKNERKVLISHDFRAQCHFKLNWNHWKKGGRSVVVALVFLDRRLQGFLRRPGSRATLVLSQS